MSKASLLPTVACLLAWPAATMAELQTSVSQCVARQDIEDVLQGGADAGLSDFAIAERKGQAAQASTLSILFRLENHASAPRRFALGFDFKDAGGTELAHVERSGIALEPGESRVVKGTAGVAAGTFAATQRICLRLRITTP